MQDLVTCFYNCKLIKNDSILRQNLWIKGGKIYNHLDDKPDLKINCRNLLISPGFIDIQINGGFNYDFSNPEHDLESSINEFSKKIVQHGVTSFCPTIITSKKDFYLKNLFKIKPRKGNKDIGANNLGFHLEGPFINSNKCGAHPKHLIQDKKNYTFKTMKDFYGNLGNVKIITLAPELFDEKTFQQLRDENIVCSMGHTEATLELAQNTFENGCNLITHLYNAMNPFHHRNPNLVGLLGGKNFIYDINGNKIKNQLYFTLISDNVHTHNNAVNIAYKCNPEGLILVTDGVSYLGSEIQNLNSIGDKNIKMVKNKAYIEGTKTLCGSVVSLNHILSNFREATDCSISETIATVTSKPAKLLNIYSSKGSLDDGSDADLVILDENFKIYATFVNGDLVWTNECVKNIFENILLNEDQLNN